MGSACVARLGPARHGCAARRVPCALATATLGAATAQEPRACPHFVLCPQRGSGLPPAFDPAHESAASSPNPCAAAGAAAILAPPLPRQPRGRRSAQPSQAASPCPGSLTPSSPCVVRGLIRRWHRGTHPWVLAWGAVQQPRAGAGGIRCSTRHPRAGPMGTSTAPGIPKSPGWGTPASPGAGTPGLLGCDTPGSPEWGTLASWGWGTPG